MWLIVKYTDYTVLGFSSPMSLSLSLRNFFSNCLSLNSVKASSKTSFVVLVLRSLNPWWEDLTSSKLSTSSWSFSSSFLSSLLSSSSSLSGEKYSAISFLSFWDAEESNLSCSPKYYWERSLPSSSLSMML